VDLVAVSASPPHCVSNSIVAAHDGEHSPDHCMLQLAMLLSRAAHAAGQGNRVQVHRGKYRGMCVCQASLASCMMQPPPCAPARLLYCNLFRHAWRSKLKGSWSHLCCVATPLVRLGAARQPHTFQWPTLSACMAMCTTRYMCAVVMSSVPWHGGLRSGNPTALCLTRRTQGEALRRQARGSLTPLCFGVLCRALLLAAAGTMPHACVSQVLGCDWQQESS
jgi:hypothetical protein